MSQPTGASLINLVWFLLFLGCVGGLVAWGVDAANKPAPAPGSVPEGIAQMPDEDRRDGRRGHDRRDRETREETRPSSTRPAAQSTSARSADATRSNSSRFASTDPDSLAPAPRTPQAVTAVPAEGQRLVAKTNHTPAIHRSDLTKGSPTDLPVAAPVASSAAKRPSQANQLDMVRIAAGRFRMGNDRSSFVSEKPAHDVTVHSFWLDRYEVTQDLFARFVEATGYRTTAERQGWAPVFNPKTDEWESLEHADWRRPRGPEGRPSELEDPVTQVSWDDASAYARWAGKRLPTEAEWEFAARGGLAGASFPWGNELMPGGKHVMNYWQGPFPAKNTRDDGFRGPAYVGSYPPNAYGLYDMSGNVWEWCSDWFSQSYYRKSPLADPPGPDHGAERVQRGGSWFCSPESNPGYMVYSRMSAPQSAMYPHVGFRCARDDSPR